MHCLNVRTELEAYMDGELGAEQVALVERHLAGCESCRAELARVQAVVKALETWPLVEEPARLTVRVMTQVRQYPVLPPFRLRWSDLAISLAGGMGILVGWALWRYLAVAGRSFLWRPDVYLYLEMLRLEFLLFVPRLIRAGVLPWGLLVVGLVMALVLIPLMWSPVEWRKRTA